MPFLECMKGLGRPLKLLKTAKVRKSCRLAFDAFDHFDHFERLRVALGLGRTKCITSIFVCTTYYGQQGDHPTKYELWREQQQKKSQLLVALRHPDPDAAGFKGFHGCLCSPLRPLLLSGPGAVQGTKCLHLGDRDRQADGGGGALGVGDLECEFIALREVVDLDCSWGGGVGQPSCSVRNCS